MRKGETIALHGLQQARSTGAHVHYEVYKHGRSVDPSSYVAPDPSAEYASSHLMLTRLRRLRAPGIVPMLNMMNCDD